VSPPSDFVERDGTPPHSVRTIIHFVCWWLALAAFAAIGLWFWGPEMRPASPSFDDPDAGLDALAKLHFGMDHGASVLRREMAPLPPDATLLVIGQGNDWRLSEAYFLISYLAWPRPVWCQGYMPEGQTAGFGNPPPRSVQPAELFFFNTVVPPAPGIRQIGDRLSVLRAPE
jgi:hypothetical protein